MFAPFLIALRDPLLRVAFLCILLMGPAISSIFPFQSVIGIERLGLSNAAYAFVVTFGSLFSVAASVFVGIVTDQTQKHRSILLICVVIGVASGVVMGAWPSIPSFLLVHLILAPISATAFTQYFALAAIAADRNPALDKDVALSLVRAGFAGTFALSAPVWAFALARGIDLLSVYWALAVINLFVLGLVFWLWPKEQPGQKDQGSGLSFFASIKELSSGHVLSRLGLITLVTSANGIYMILLGLLIVTVLGGREADIGLFTGGVAIVELPVMLGGAILLRKFTRTQVILAGSVIYAASLTALGFMPTMAYAWWLIIPFGIGAGIILSVPVGYIQSLVEHRPGAGSSLISLSHFGGTLAASALFAVGAGNIGYVGVACTAAIVSLAAACLLFSIERETQPAA